MCSFRKLLTSVQISEWKPFYESFIHVYMQRAFEKRKGLYIFCGLASYTIVLLFMNTAFA